MKSLEKILISEGLKKVDTGYYVVPRAGPAIEGICIEKAPSGFYIWMFILPSFDRFRFFHLTLGERVLFLPRKLEGADIEQFENFVQTTWRQRPSIQSVDDVAKIINKDQGGYASWVSYLIAVIKGNAADLANVERLLSSQVADHPSLFFADDFAELSVAGARDDLSAKRAIVQQWQDENAARFFDLPTVG